jgi:hypothetical protein
LAQHDYNIANNPGGTVRADINALAEAIASLNGGSSAPSVTFAHMLWADEANTLLKIRNAANSGWITLGSLGASKYQYLGDAIAIAQGGTAATTNYAASDNLAATGYVDVASATPNIGAAASQKVRITGTTTITAFDTVAAGIERQLYFAGSLQLTYNVTSMQLPGGLNIQTQAGDQAKAISLGSGNWRIVNYQSAVPPNIGYRYIGRQIFTGSGTYTPTPGTRFIRVRLVGAGGGGGGARITGTGYGAAGGGGGAGLFQDLEALLSAFTATVAVTIGAAGTAGASTGGNGGTGGTTSFGAYATAVGGSGGIGISGSNVNNCGDGGVGGLISGSTIYSGALAGQGGSGHGGSSGDGGSGSQGIFSSAGNGGASVFGGGGVGHDGDNEDTAGDPGVAYGSGGGGGLVAHEFGGTGTAAGGAGAPGVLIVEEFA